MPVMTEERQGQATRASVRRPASGVTIDPARLAWYRESDDMGHPVWSRQDLSRAVARLALEDEDGPLTVTRDAIAKIENGERKPKARTVRALCAALGVGVRDLMPGGEELAPHAGAAERKLRLAHNRELRAFARAHGIRYRNPSSGRVYYSVPLREAWAAAVGGADDEAVTALIDRARDGDGPGGGNADYETIPVDAEDGIEELDLSARTYNALTRNGVRTVGQLSDCSTADLLDPGFKGLGAASVAEITARMHAAGFTLAGEEPDPERLAS